MEGYTDKEIEDAHVVGNTLVLFMKALRVVKKDNSAWELEDFVPCEQMVEAQFKKWVREVINESK
jgi:hypothetical protein